MIFKITYKLCGMEFLAEARSIAQAYEYIYAIVKANGVNLPCWEKALSEYMAVLVKFQDGKLLKVENHFFRIEVDRSGERTQSLADALIDAEKTIGRMYGACGAYCDSLVEGYWERKKEREKRWAKEGSRNDL